MSSAPKLTALAAVAAGAALAVPAAASAHVSFHPNAVPAGSFATLHVRVPNEQSDADITSVRMKLPEGVLSALGAPPSGWTFKATTKELVKPIQTDDGPVTSEVTEVTFSGGHTPPGQFADLPIALGLPEAAKQGDVVAFPTVQTYSNGEVARWIGSADDEQPAPTLDVTKAGTALLDVTGGDAGPPAKLPTDLAGASSGATTSAAAAPAPAATTTTVEEQSSGLSVVALIVGALGLLAGGLALLTTRRRTAA